MFYGVMLLFCLVVLAGMVCGQKKLAQMTPEQLKAHEEKQEFANQMHQERMVVWSHGHLNSAMICPHCQVSGRVHTKQVTKKTGISGAKATAAILTDGVSLLATGLSDKERKTEAYCRNCRNTWVF
jgi:hypothetical protein